MSTRMRSRGVGLLEMLVALSIMALSLSMVYRALGGSARGIGQVQAAQGAALLGHSLLDALGIVEPQGAAITGEDGIYTWRITSTPIAVPTNPSSAPSLVLHRVQIVIGWGDSAQWILETLRPQRSTQPGPVGS